MKLKNLGMILLGLPLVCQVALGVVLIYDLNQLDSAAKREAHAKRIITTCQDVRAAVSTYWLRLGVQRYESSEDSAQKLTEFSKLIEERTKTLTQLVSGDKASEDLVRTYASQLHQLTRLLADAGVNYPGGSVGNHVARFVQESEFFEEFMSSSKSMLACEKQLMERYSPIVDEFQPKAIHEREMALNMVIFGVAMNSLLVIALAAVFGRFTLARLNRLMGNIDKFSKGNVALDPVGGKDEIGELDKEFRLMAESRNQAEQLRRSLSAMVSHDLRSPLTSASLTLSMVLQMDSKSLSAATLKKLERLNAEISRLVKLASSALDMEQIECGKLELNKKENNVKLLISGAADAVKGLADAKHVSISNMVDNDKTIVCDGDRIMQILVNLISNSLRYAPRESVVSVSLGVDPTTGVARFTVTDKGPGVPQSERSKLFTRFAQIAGTEITPGAGSGLGLHICKLLIEAHGGRIGADYPADGGSCFWFEIPQSGAS